MASIHVGCNTVKASAENGRATKMIPFTCGHLNSSFDELCITMHGQFKRVGGLLLLCDSELKLKSLSMLNWHVSM